MERTILIIDDDPSFRFAIKEYMAIYDFYVEEAGNALSGMELFIQNNDINCILLDLNLPDADGIEIIPRLLNVRPGVYIVVISAYSDTEKIVKAIKNGAYDYIIKPIDFEVIKFQLEKIFSSIQLKKQLTILEEGNQPILIGNSEAISDIKKFIQQVAPSDLPVLITGETGTGKEVVARLIHNMSGRKGAFVELNCSSIHEELFESEVFGHSQYSFTDAKRERVGKVRTAENGTLFLDEIGEMPVSLQPKLLRFLETKEFWPLGADKKIKADTRIICATNRDIKESLGENRIRKDLYYRLSTLHIHLPPLRERREDILSLAEHFLKAAARNSGKKINGIDNFLREYLYNYNYPGNIRELKNMIERAVIFCNTNILSSEHLGNTQDFKSRDTQMNIGGLEEMEREFITRAFLSAGKNISKAAKALKISRTTLRDKLRRYGVI